MGFAVDDFDDFDGLADFDGFRPDDETASNRCEALLARLKDLQVHDAKALQTIGGHNVTARIHELRQEGWNIKTSHGKGKFAQYRLVSLEKLDPKSRRAQVLLTFDELRELLEYNTVPASMLPACAAAYDRLEGKRDAEPEPEAETNIIDLFGD